MPRVYAVESSDELTLVTANSQAQALNHVAKGQFKVKTASAMDVLEYIQAGGVVEDACGGNTPTQEEAVEGEDQSE